MNIYTTAKISPAGKVNITDLKKWGWNLLLFTAPSLALFFGQLHAGVDWKIASGVALLALYGAIADFLKKLADGKK